MLGRSVGPLWTEEELQVFKMWFEFWIRFMVKLELD